MYWIILGIPLSFGAETFRRMGAIGGNPAMKNEIGRTQRPTSTLAADQELSYRTDSPASTLRGQILDLTAACA
jgi:hypothetical protein